MVLSSGDGTKLFALRDGYFSDGSLWRSTDSGRTWASTGRSFGRVAVSSDGDHLMGTGNGWIYTSTDAGK